MYWIDDGIERDFFDTYEEASDYCDRYHINKWLISS